MIGGAVLGGPLRQTSGGKTYNAGRGIKYSYVTISDEAWVWIGPCPSFGNIMIQTHLADRCPVKQQQQYNCTEISCVRDEPNMIVFHVQVYLLGILKPFNIKKHFLDFWNWIGINGRNISHRLYLGHFI